MVAPFTPARSFCSFRKVDMKMSQHVEHLRSEINKRRHRLELECANALGLVTPWKRARVRQTVKPTATRKSTIINPNDISLHFDHPNESNQHTPTINNNAAQIEQSGSTMYEVNATNQLPMPANYEAEMARQKTMRKRVNEAEMCSQCTKGFDTRRFCIRCSACQQKFHGKCIGMSEKKAKKLTTAWKCRSCREAYARQVHAMQELFCICKQPYDQKKFYVGCDECQDWFHPECVGTTRHAIETTEASYICPKCRNRDDVIERYAL